MDFHITQRTRSLLQTRARRVKASGVGQYQEQLKFFLQFIETNPVFRSALALLLKKSTITEDEINAAIQRNNGYDFKTETDYVAAAFYVLKWLTKQTPGANDVFFDAAQFAGSSGNLDESIEGINDHWLDHLYDYLDESVDNRNTTLLLLQKYKQRSEWFWRNRLRGIAFNGEIFKKDGEKGLMLDLYEYLHGQGLDFKIEPSSASGEVDLIADQADEDRVVLDGKLIKEADGDAAAKRKVIRGFRQVHDYCCDYNVNTGHLIVFNDLGKALGVESEKSDGFDYVNLNGKHIYFLVIDIHEYEATASKRGALEVVTIAKNDLVQGLTSSEQ